MGDKPWPASSSGSICSRIVRQRSNSACQSIGFAFATAASIGSIAIAKSVCFISHPRTGSMIGQGERTPLLAPSSRIGSQTFRRLQGGINIGMPTSQGDAQQLVIAYLLHMREPVAHSSNSGAMIRPSPKEPWSVWVLLENEEAYYAVV